MRIVTLLNNRAIWGVILLITALAISWTSVVKADSNSSLMADLTDAQGRNVGMATLSEMEDGMVHVKVTVNGMEPIPGDHRMAIAKVGMCETPDFTSAGEDFGTFPNIQFYASGSADYDLVVEGLSLQDLRDADGSTVIIYADAGDNSGARIICGVLQQDGMTTAPAATEMPIVETEAPAIATSVPPTSVPATEAPTTATSTPGPTAEAQGNDLIGKSAGGLFIDSSGRLVGLGILVPGEGDVVGAGIAIEGMAPIAGGHRLAIAKTGACQTPDFVSAGDELTQLPEIQFYADGSADYVGAANGVSIDSLLDSDLSALIIYADKGDQPGDRIACAELQPLDKLLAELGIEESELLSYKFQN